MESFNRRQFLKTASATAAVSALASQGLAVARRATPDPVRVVFLRFGGGVRHSDVFGPEDRCLAPTLRAFAREGTLYTDLWNDHLTRHDCATLYLLTGRYGARQDDNAAGEINLTELRSAALVHEGWRRSLKTPLHKALAVGVPDHSDHPLHGAPFRAASFAAQIAPTAKHTTKDSEKAKDAENAENAKDATDAKVAKVAMDAGPAVPSYSGDPTLWNPEELSQGNERLGRLALELSGPDVPKTASRLREYARAAVAKDLELYTKLPCEELAPAWTEALIARCTSSRPFVTASKADAWLTDLTLAGMRELRPDLVTVGYVTPDLAHRGSWRDYAAAVRGLDQEVRRVIDHVNTDDYYRGRTLVLVAPDCGRGSADFTEHDRPFEDESHRRLFLAAYGHGAVPGRVIEDRREQTTVAQTIAAKLGFHLAQAESEALPELL